jgi:hypothetical protein
MSQNMIEFYLSAKLNCAAYKSGLSFFALDLYNLNIHVMPVLLSIFDSLVFYWEPVTE